MQKTAKSGLYGRDFVEWTKRNSDLLRRGCFTQADIEHIAQEIEDMGKRDARELESRIKQVLEHRLKIHYTRGQSENHAHCAHEVSDQQGEIEVLLDQSPSLRPQVEDLIPRAYRRARNSFQNEYSTDAGETPNQCPWQVEDILGGR